MRATLRLAILLMGAAACGDSVPVVDMDGVDMAPDFSTGMTGCKGFIACADTCPDPPMGSCPVACAQNVTQHGFDLVVAARTCAGNYCVNAGTCVWDASMALMAAPGHTQTECNNCFHDAQAPLYGAALTCINPGGPDCTESQCTQEFGACLSDLP
jgi:hypothetical protein